VKTKCGIPTAGSGSSATWVNNKILLFDARTQFCRDDIKFDKNDNSSGAYTQQVEVINLCRKTDSTYANNRGGNPFDSKDYFCDNSDGKVKKKCLETFYEDETQFCYKEGNTAIAVGNKCRVNPFPATNETVQFLPAQYDPRKQFCTIKISSLPTSNANNILPANAALQILNGQVQSGINIGSSWVNSTSSVVLQTNYTTNAFPNVYIAPTLSGTTQQGGTVGYTYVEVPEDMCQNSIKYNSGNWLWQSCLVTNVQDRTKDRYLHCGVGERPKEDFSGCEKIPNIVVVSCNSASQVLFWNNTCKTGSSPLAAADCGGTPTSGTNAIAGVTLGSIAPNTGNACVCADGYTINSQTSPTACTGDVNECPYNKVKDVTGSCENACSLNSQLTGTATANGICACNATYPTHPFGTASGCLANNAAACTDLGGQVAAGATACTCDVTGSVYTTPTATGCKSTATGTCIYPQVWDAAASTPACVLVANCTDNNGATDGVCDTP